MGKNEDDEGCGPDGCGILIVCIGLEDVFEWFEMACRRDKRILMVCEFMNDRFKKHCIEKRGFFAIPGTNDIAKVITENITMWSYYGSKEGIKRFYPKPLYGHIIEPFAGTAKYSLLYWDRQVTLIDKYEVLITRTGDESI